MIAVDTNILIYAHRSESPFHPTAARRLTELSRQSSWAIPWPCVQEFLAITTHPKIYDPPTPTLAAIGQIDTLIASRTLQLLAETSSHWSQLRSMMRNGRLRGGILHDAKIAAICIQHGVREFWSADRDFSRFPELKTVNPLV